MIREEEVFKIGQFAKPHGIKGELSLFSGSDVLEEAEDPYIVCDIDGILVPFFVESFRYKSDSVILVKLEGVDDERAAREFANRTAFYPIGEMNEDELPGAVAWDHLLGYEVVDERYGNLGKVTGIEDSTLNILFRIEGEKGEFLFPAAEGPIRAIDTVGKKVSVSVPEGLLDL